MSNPRGLTADLELTETKASERLAKFFQPVDEEDIEDDFVLVSLKKLLEDEDIRSDYDMVMPPEILAMEREYIAEEKNKLIRYNYPLLAGKGLKPIHFVFSHDMIENLSLPIQAEEKFTEAEMTKKKLQFMQQIAMSLLTIYTRPYKISHFIAALDANLAKRQDAVMAELEGADDITFVISSALPDKTDNKCVITCSRHVGKKEIQDTLTIPLPSPENVSKFKFYIPGDADNFKADNIVEIEELTAPEKYAVAAELNPVPEVVAVADSEDKPEHDDLEDAPVIVHGEPKKSALRNPDNARPRKNILFDAGTVAIEEVKEAKEAIAQKAINQIQRILEKQAFWLDQTRMANGAPKRIENMQRIANTSKLEDFANHAKSALDDKSWYQKCCSCLFTKPVLRTDTTQDFYKIVANAATNPELAIRELTQWERKYNPETFRTPRKDGYVFLGGRF